MNPEQARQPQLEDDGEIHEAQLSEVAKAKPAEGFSLYDLMEESEAVIFASEKAGTWKLDQRVADIAANPKSPQFAELQKLVEQIKPYQELAMELDYAEGQLTRYQLGKWLYQLACLAPSAFLAWDFISQVTERGQADMLRALILVMPAIVGLALLNSKHLYLEVDDKVVIDKPLWVELEKTQTSVNGINDDMDTLYEKISQGFRSLGFRWYLREDMFDEALDHIVTVYENGSMFNDEENW